MKARQSELAQKNKTIGILWIIQYSCKWNLLDLSFNICAASWQNQQNDVHPAKTQISLDICPVWQESSLSAWRKLRSLATHWAHCKDWVDAEADLSLHWVHRTFCWFCHEVAQFFHGTIYFRFQQPCSEICFYDRHLSRQWKTVCLKLVEDS